MRLKYVCPRCLREMTVYPNEELNRTTEKVTYLCTCSYCKAKTEVSIENTGDIKTFEEQRTFDLEFGKDNDYELGMN